MPEYGFYEAHLNAYNRDYWVKVAEGTAEQLSLKMVILQRIPTRRSRKLKWHARIFKWRKENYQFSARAVIDRYKKTICR